MQDSIIFDSSLFLPMLYLMIHQIWSQTDGVSLVAQSKESACIEGNVGLMPGFGRCPGEGNDNPLQFLAWEIPWTEEPGGLQSMESLQNQT